MKQTRNVVCTLALLLCWTGTSQAQSTGTARVLGTGETVTYQVVAGKALFQGDILLGEHADVQKNGVRPLTVSTAGTMAMEPQRSAWSGNQTWINSVVPYELVPSLPMDARNAVNEAMRWISSQTRITFVPRTNQFDYIRIVSGNGCYSQVGRTGGMQDLSMGPGCGSPASPHTSCSTPSASGTSSRAPTATSTSSFTRRTSIKTSYTTSTSTESRLCSSAATTSIRSCTTATWTSAATGR